MSVTCEICGEEFKTTQGLRGHKTFRHQMTTSEVPPARLASDQRLTEVEDAIKQMVNTDKQLLDLLGKQIAVTEHLTQYINEIGEQVSKLAKQVSNTETETRKLSQEASKRHHELVQLEIDLKRISRYVQYEFADINDDIIWEMCLDKPELKSRIKLQKLKLK